MKKIDVNFLEPSMQQLNDLLEYYQTGRYEDAETNYKNFNNV